MQVIHNHIYLSLEDMVSLGCLVEVMLDSWIFIGWSFMHKINIVKAQVSEVFTVVIMLFSL
jgi:hypothetical protein